jgi:hypothetical protein
MLCCRGFRSPPFHYYTSRSVWAIDEHMHTDLVQAALAMAVAMRSELADVVILHADLGCQPRFNGSSQHRLRSLRGSPRAQPGPIRWPHSGVLVQRPCGIIPGHVESRVLREIPMAYQGN